MYPIREFISRSNTFALRSCSVRSSLYLFDYKAHIKKLDFEIFMVQQQLLKDRFKKNWRNIEYGIFGEGSHISTNQKRESTVFSLLIG